jgi:hypothetical protein
MRPATYLANKALSIKSFNHPADAFHILDIHILRWVTLREERLLGRLLGVLNFLYAEKLRLSFQCLMDFDSSSPFKGQINVIRNCFIDTLFTITT